MLGMTRPPDASRTVLITGCSSGIGHATALHLHTLGWTVYATARHVDALRDLADVGCRVLALDVTNDESMRGAVSTIERDHGSVGALVNNAGFSLGGAIETTDVTRARAQFETNVFGPMRLVQLVLPGMRRMRAGRIVNVGSMGGTLVLPGAAYYHATKYALEALTDALRFEVNGFGIHVSLIQPGLIRSRFAATAVDTAGAAPTDAHDPYGPFLSEVRRITTESYEKGRMAPLAGNPEDVARVIARALTDPRPRTRYRVTPSATVLMTLRRLLGDRGWDGFLRRTYVSPR